MNLYRITYKILIKQYHIKVFKTGQKFINKQNPKINNYYTLYYKELNIYLFIIAINKI